MFAYPLASNDLLFSVSFSIHGMKIYIAPSKALVQEKLRDWNQKLGSLGISCLELTGDNEFYNVRTIQEADIIVTTPEVRFSILYIHMFTN